MPRHMRDVGRPAAGQKRSVISTSSLRSSSTMAALKRPSSRSRNATRSRRQPCRKTSAAVPVENRSPACSSRVRSSATRWNSPSRTRCRRPSAEVACVCARRVSSDTTPRAGPRAFPASVDRQPATGSGAAALEHGLDERRLRTAGRTPNRTQSRHQRLRRGRGRGRAHAGRRAGPTPDPRSRTAPGGPARDAGCELHRTGAGQVRTPGATAPA